jgi:cyclohexyl-isocyanide hydratase
METNEKRLDIGMLLYPGFTMLDLVGPLTVFGMHSQIHLLWKSLDPVVSDIGIAMVPTTRLEDCPARLDVLFVPGGFGTAEAMEDAELVEFLKDMAPRADYVTSVCSGSLILGAAGLLEGYRATSHWATRERLRSFGATPIAERVVTDRNRVTGGGVTAGIDFGLVLLAKLRGIEAAQTTQLIMEYDPHPPFDAGSPEKAGPQIVQRVKSLIEEADKQLELAVRA